MLGCCERQGVRVAGSAGRASRVIWEAADRYSESRQHRLWAAGTHNVLHCRYELCRMEGQTLLSVEGTFASSFFISQIMPLSSTMTGMKVCPHS